MNSRKLLLLLPVLFFVASCSRDPKVQAQRYVENGNKFFQKGKFKEASIMYRRALQKDLRFGEAYYRLALTEISLASYGEAVRSLRRAVELQPDNADAAVKLADIYMLAATQDKGNSQEYLKEAKELADKLLQKNAKSYDGHRIEGQIALLQNDAAGAVEQLKAAAQIKPDETDLALAYFQALAANKQTDEAEKLALAMIDKHKNFAPMYDMLYVHYIADKKIAEAENIMKRKVENNPRQANFRVQLASHYMSTQQKPEFDKTIQALNDEKQYPEGHLVAGDFYFYRTRDFDAARAQYEAGAKAFPKEQAIYQKRLVELLATTGNNTEANELLATVLKQNPKDTDAIAMRAALMLTTGDAAQINQAVNDLQSLVAKSPDNHLLRFNLGRAYLAKN
ncbi:MAG: tetratricopeptide repeat protein, partial [Acidobacteriota bacterium]|nr:tetratricopeptide repeat protein [Acidobacteriota bacterium]